MEGRELVLMAAGAVCAVALFVWAARGHAAYRRRRAKLRRIAEE